MFPETIGSPLLTGAGFLASGAAVLVMSDLFEFSWRYQLPALVTLVPAGALVNVFALDLAYHVSPGATHIAILLLALDAVLQAHYSRPLAGLLLHGKCELPDIRSTDS